MAGDEDKTVIEGKDAEQEAAQKKKGSNKFLLFGGIGFGAIIIGVALTMFVIKPMMSGSENGDAQHAEEVVDDSHSDDEDNQESGSHGGKG